MELSLHPLFRFCSNPRSRSKARSSPLSFDTGPRHRRCSPTNPRNASNKRGQPRCCSSERREELCRTFARTSSSSSAGSRTPRQTTAGFVPEGVSRTEFAHVTRKNINIWRFLRTNATLIFTFSIRETKISLPHTPAYTRVYRPNFQVKTTRFRYFLDRVEKFFTYLKIIVTIIPER